VLGRVIQLRQRSYADAAIRQGFDTLQAGNASNVDEPRRLDDADARPIEELGPTGEHHRVRQTGESNRICARGRLRIPEIAQSHFLPGSGFDGGGDLRISGATTDIAAHPLADFRVRARGALGDAAHRRHDLPAGTKPALEGVVVDEGLLDGVKVWPIREPFDRRDLAPIRRRGKHQAGIHPPAVQQHGAGAAFAAVAALLGPVSCSRSRSMSSSVTRGCNWS